MRISDWSSDVCSSDLRKTELDDRRAGGDVDDRDLVPARDRFGQRDSLRDVEPLAGVQIAQRGRDRIAGVDENGVVRGHGRRGILALWAGLSSIENGVISPNVNVIYHQSNRPCKRASRIGAGSKRAGRGRTPRPLPAPPHDSATEQTPDINAPLV